MSRLSVVPNPPDAPRPATQRRSPLMLLAGLVLLSRVLIFEIGALSYRYLPHAWVQNVPGYLAPSGGYWFQSLLGVWAHWDGYWYLSIAKMGYTGRSISTAFFPLYPLLVHLLGGMALSGVILSLCCFGVGAWLLFLLARRELGEDAAWYAVLALLFFPSSFYLNAVYPESLVLMLSVASVYLALQRRFLYAALIAGVASAASADGLLLGLPIAILLWQERRPLREWSVLALVPSGLLGYMAYLWLGFGNPLTFQAAQANWGRSFSPFWVTFWRAAVQFAGHLPALDWPNLFARGQATIATSNVWNLVFALIGVALVVVAARALRPAIWSYAAAVLIIPIFYPSSSVPLMSAPRFLLSAWPVFMAAGWLLARRPKLLRPTLIVSALVGALFVALFATAHWVA